MFLSEAADHSSSEGARVAGTGGCNRFVGGYVPTDREVTITKLGSTMMACSEDVMPGAHRFVRRGRELVLESDAGTVRLIESTGDGGQ
jgi:heat shock protein HslJ